MRCRHLTRDDLEAVHAAFLAAFADYAVAQQPTRAAFQAMLRRRGIAWERSVGVESERGFAAVMAVGVDAWQGAPTAYDIFTGVRPESRGQGLAGEMLRFALPGLRARGVRRFVLEVLEGNASALAAYRRVGFAVTRDLQCFTLPRATVAAAATTGVEVSPIDEPDWAALRRFGSWAPTWQNDCAALERADRTHRRVLGARVDGALQGYGVVFVDSGDVPQLAVAPAARRRGVGRALVSALAALSETDALRILNVELAVRGELEFWRALGASETVRQHEMKLSL